MKRSRGIYGACRHPDTAAYGIADFEARVLSESPYIESKIIKGAAESAVFHKIPDLSGYSYSEIFAVEDSTAAVLLTPADYPSISDKKIYQDKQQSEDLYGEL